MAKILLEMKNITKTFPGVKALDNVNLKVEEGEIHALLFTIDRNKGGFRALQEEQVTTDEVESFLENNEDLTYHDLKSNNVEAVCCYIRVSGRVKKSIITLHQKTGKVTMSTTI